MSKYVTVKNTAWGSTFEIGILPVNEQQSRVLLRFPTGGVHASDKKFDNQELPTVVKWVKNRAKTKNIYPLLNKFHEHIEDSPFQL